MICIAPTETRAFSPCSYAITNVRSFATSSTATITTAWSTSTDSETPQPAPTPRPSAGIERDHEEPEDVIIHIAPKAMVRLRELRLKKPVDEPLILRMGVRNGGCSGLSYVMDFSTEDEIEDGDAIDDYEDEGVLCVVDAKSMLYLYGLELDYSDDLIGGGFKFFNPNAEESCGCGSSFGI
eukprot:CAMPEP_0198250334 /NCGR_PEP_ID=MMETSP1447-20131203/1559_1 /TAXON_ID=420782 /ORGANISM="Chaetoceros dichaeta, Strain CCMP1751" /LENGTH=180 /DNA_ID=CAMNT_0043935149 /DNA_START=222 /DNA_END=764 /DNA_ORIENTATION=-